VTVKELLHHEVDQLSEPEALALLARLREPGGPLGRPTLRELARWPIGVRAAWLASAPIESESELIDEWDVIDPNEPEAGD
jgi:hypothetical protein